ncbi:hypothetical protein [Sphingomonas montanisoli]|uniref:Uncharacterized protein n=1 Tax=Sphingomonas montanisoli TaxID=2606412 RepID=A0A5D9BZL6_9SPHN|nr:hypothetical protein [Sphingomonas montanisoli]TZG24899.1 hypothetical protein FYJ91_16600 [Sphingomonas montanisoli]
MQDAVLVAHPECDVAGAILRRLAEQPTGQPERASDDLPFAIVPLPLQYKSAIDSHSSEASRGGATRALQNALGTENDPRSDRVRNGSLKPERPAAKRQPPAWMIAPAWSRVIRRLALESLKRSNPYG